MKVALLQFAPEVGKVKENIQRADEMLQETKLPVDLDWLVLPEMAFSGMCWPMGQETIPFSGRSETLGTIAALFVLRDHREIAIAI
jgi:predicted amidohydrolase